MRIVNWLSGACVLLLLIGAAQAHATPLLQLTASGGLRAAGSDYVYYASDGTDFEVFLYDGTAIVQLTDNDSDDRFPHASTSARLG